MRGCRVSSKSFSLFLFFYIVVSVILILYLPFTQVEYHLLEKEGFLTPLFAKAIYSTTHSYIVMRIAFFSLALASLYLLREIASLYLKKEFVYLSLVIYLLTPGVFVSFIIANSASIALFLTLLFIYSYEKRAIFLELLSLVLLFFTHTPIFILYLAVSFFAFYQKRWYLFGVAFTLFALSFLLSPFSIGGVPKGHIVELFISYAAIFSPFYFIAIVYTIYRLAKDKELSLLWYITSFFLISSILLSLRQRVDVVEFAPFIVIIAPLVVLIFRNSIAIRLQRFQKWHLRVCKIVVLFLLIESTLIALSYPIYQLSNGKIKIVNSKIYTIKAREF